jgi:hypothetical protein
MEQLKKRLLTYRSKHKKYEIKKHDIFKLLKE